jgi:hypothetical protein
MAFSNEKNHVVQDPSAQRIAVGAAALGCLRELGFAPALLAFQLGCGSKQVESSNATPDQANNGGGGGVVGGGGMSGAAGGGTSNSDDASTFTDATGSTDNRRSPMRKQTPKEQVGKRTRTAEPSISSPRS